MHGKIKLKLENENYRDEKCVTQTAWMTRTNENYKSESIEIKIIPMKTAWLELHEWRERTKAIKVKV